MHDKSASILILNCGGSSIKCKLVDMPHYSILASIDIGRIGLPYGEVKIQSEKVNRDFQQHVSNHEEGIQIILDLLLGELSINKKEIDLIGHRIVHGGKMTGSTVVDKELIQYLVDISDLAPLHNPAHVAGILACGKILPGVRQIAVFDNAYHQSLSKAAASYAIPYGLAEKYGIRKYGFHGIAFRSMLQSSKKILASELKDKKIVLLMLGSGTTANASINGVSYDVSTGFTPHEGLIQSTRSGDTDAAVYTFLMRKEGWGPDQIDDLMNRQSGWLGMSGISSDLREIHDAAEKGNERGQVAIDALSHRIKKYIGAYAAVMGGIDLVAFGGGVGEHAWYAREKVCDGMEFLGIELDHEKNKKIKGSGVVSTQRSRTKVLITKVDEEEIIAMDTFKIGMK
ncbi:acetate/propionate family kinase [Alkalibacter rhizosphaerae]|uniref:Acetate kinase n=1 Tax=Alkalibacter rhizosphaerae TaxID=2815577 RepID=A0A974XFL0_9FIRM|nr:acetate/propionate family kinase [Alkalibacter rhizosphaerae]QSX08952.1 acetate/propionate family kinase [Alkalibacter rhizosphaerae]